MPSRTKWRLVYCLYLTAVIVTVDVLVLKKLLNYGYPRHYEQENIQRYPAPYVAFTGRPNAADHNELGFRGRSLAESGSVNFMVAFFGGSTGYNGTPPIADLLEEKLGRLLREDIFVANYSVVSSHHRQHLHGIVEFLPQHEPDLVIFYGGHNETIQSANYDPRPGYPFNHFYRQETGPFVKLLLENSAIVGEMDRRLGNVLTGLARLRAQERPFSEAWNRRIADKYFETLSLAHKVARAIGSRRFGEARFMAFYQPYQVPEPFIAAHEDIRARIGSLSYVYDVSSTYRALGEAAYVDRVHVTQKAKKLMAERMARIIAAEVR